MVITVHGFYLKVSIVINSSGSDLSEVDVKEEMFFKFLPRQKNTWVAFGTGKAPSA